MRVRLLDATIDSLIDLGYSATTTTVIADRAGVSRGAQLHHFPTKAELVAAAVEHLANRIGAELRRDAAKVKDRDVPVAEIIDALWSRYQSPLFAAWLELSVAARTDADLREALAPVENRLRTSMSEWVLDAFGERMRDDGVDVWMLTYYVLQGIALDRTVITENPRRRNQRVTQALEAWKRVLSERVAR
jgi:AcrR family transcriptional regulator